VKVRDDGLSHNGVTVTSCEMGSSECGTWVLLLVITSTSVAQLHMTLLVNA
jgi:hypothetical protein